MKNLLEIEKSLQTKTIELNTATTTYNDFVKVMDAEISELKRLKQISNSGLDVEKIKNAESILDIDGLRYGKYNERCVREAISDLLSESPKMTKQYFGVKNYDRWSDQESDHPYGYGPSHGSITFSVGFKRAYRGELLTDDQKEVCLYYLNVLKDKESRLSIAGLTKTA